jgi:polar amino acid transport system substrate-binding protein
MKIFALLAIALALASGARAATAEENAVAQLAPTGPLRVGVAYAPAVTPLFVVRDAGGEVHGVPRDLGEALAKALGVPVAFTVAPTTAEIADACESGALDIGFMPVSDERRKRFDFSPPYFFIASTDLAAGPTDIRNYADVDQPGITVVGIAGSTTQLAAARSLKNAKVVAAKSIDEALAMMQAGTVQAVALPHDSLPALQKQLPGSRILAGTFHIAGVAIALRKNRPEALAFLTAFIERAKADGAIRRAFDAAGLEHLAVAP